MQLGMRERHRETQADVQRDSQSTVVAHLPTLQRFLLSAAGVKCPACECTCKAPPPKRAAESCTAKSISTLNRVAEAMRGEA